MELLFEPFTYTYMRNAIWVCSLVGGVCAFLSAYLMLKGWSLIGDALSHAIVPGVAGAWLLGLPFSLGAFFAGTLAAAAMLFVRQRTRLREDVVIGMIFSSFFGLGLFILSLSPIPVNVMTLAQGNVLAITPQDTQQLLIIGWFTPFMAENIIFCIVISLYRRRHDDGGCIFSHCHGSDTWGNSLFAV